VEALYATFPRRLNALSTDAVVAVIFTAVVFWLLSTTELAPPLRLPLLVAWVGALLLYEPILVSRYGGTVGHLLFNLRVVDDHTGGNLGFWTAVARVWVKGFFGVFSFVTMAASSRHQAIHDMVTRSTVQIRDPSKAKAFRYVTYRPEPPARAT
jgi:uncharacterized RDD family membrane protein YckC